MNLTSQNVDEVFKDCLYTNEELSEFDLVPGEPPDEAVLADGVMLNVGFNPAKIQHHRETITNLLLGLPDEFLSTKGGGWSFLNACMDREGNHWAEHPTIDKLLCLGIATELVSYVMPRNMWSMFPGSMPYFVVKL